MNYFETLKPNLVDEPYQRKMCNSFELSVDFNGCDYSKGNDHETNGIMTW